MNLMIKMESMQLNVCVVEWRILNTEISISFAYDNNKRRHLLGAAAGILPLAGGVTGVNWGSIPPLKKKLKKKMILSIFLSNFMVMQMRLLNGFIMQMKSMLLQFVPWYANSASDWSPPTPQWYVSPPAHQEGVKKKVIPRGWANSIEHTFHPRYGVTRCVDHLNDLLWFITFMLFTSFAYCWIFYFNFQVIDFIFFF